MTDCAFCKLYESGREIEQTGGGPFWFKFDAYPVSPGHILIIPKHHISALGELLDYHWSKLHQALSEARSLIHHTDLSILYQKMLAGDLPENSASYLRHALRHPRINTVPDGYNIGVNEGREAGQTVNHLHIHTIPRYAGDMERPEGGVRNVIPELGNYKIPLR